MGIPNKNPFNKIKCGEASTDKSLVFGNGSANIIQGANTLLSVSLAGFIPVDLYQYKEFKLSANTSPSTGQNSMQLEACNTTNANGEETGIIILVDYPQLDVSGSPIPTEDKYINFTYPIGGQVMSIGKIMVLTGTNKAGEGWDLIASPGGLVLMNPHANFGVSIRVLIIT